MVGVAELATITDDLGRVAPRTILLLQLAETADKLARIEIVLKRRRVINAGIKVVVTGLKFSRHPES